MFQNNNQHLHFPAGQASHQRRLVNALEQCVVAIGHWMSADRLKLNAEKTELMWAGVRYTVASFLRLHDLTLTLGSSTVKAANAVRLLGVLLHRTLHSRST